MSESMEKLYASKTMPTNTKILEFADLPSNFVAYNPSKVFLENERPVIAVRVEPLDDELDSHTLFYDYQTDRPLERHNDLVFDWQDPCVAHIQDQLIVGGVRILRNPSNPAVTDTFFTEFYIGSTLNDLKFLCRGPEREKDIRLVDMGNKTGVYGRPQNGHATGDISFTTINNPNELSTNVIGSAQIITKDLFEKGMWCGVNDAIYLGNGINLVIGHVARYNPDNPNLKDYHGIHFMHDTNSGLIYNLIINASALDYPTINTRSAELKNVYFSGGIEENRDILPRIARLGHEVVEFTFNISGGCSDSAAAIGNFTINLAI